MIIIYQKLNNRQNNIIKMRPSKYRKDKTPIFIHKLYSILSDHNNTEIVDWIEDQNGFKILDLTKFTKQLLPKFFKHSNYNSFVRQLNMYNFNKIRYTVDGISYDHVYHHQLFVKDNQKDFKNIRRKQTIVKCESLIRYGSNLDQQNNISQYIQQEQMSLAQKLSQIKQKQQKLQQFCFQLISQNQVLLSQNQQLAIKVKKESRKKQKLLQQVFRIVGISIAEFWDQFCQGTETLQQKTANFKQIYQMLMNFVQKNQLEEILKTLELFIAPKTKTKIFKVIDPEQEQNFINMYNQEQIEEFITQTNIILEAKDNN